MPIPLTYLESVCLQGATSVDSLGSFGMHFRASRDSGQIEVWGRFPISDGAVAVVMWVDDLCPDCVWPVAVFLTVVARVEHGIWYGRGNMPRELLKAFPPFVCGVLRPRAWQAAANDLLLATDAQRRPRPDWAAMPSGA